MNLEMDAERFVKQSQPFLTWVAEWYNNLEMVSLDQLAGDPTKIAVIATDVTKGFCKSGPLASPRMASIVEPVVELFRAAWAHGVRHILLIQDAHTEDAVEFAQWGPHNIYDTEEAETVEAVKALPFFNELVVLEKNSISPAIDTELDEWLDTHPEIATFIVVGGWTDIYTYQLAMHLRMRANARQLGGMRVIVPVNTVDTFDLPPDEAGALSPHDGDLMHRIFLYNMMQNGISIVAAITH